MKKLLLIVLAVASVSAVSAQKIVRGGGRVHYVRPPHVIVGIGAGGFYNPFYSPWGMGGFYSPFYPGYGFYNSRPSKLDMKVEDIKSEYQDKIHTARADKTVPRRERKQIIKDLKKERDETILQARKDYYESAFRHKSDRS